jgi:chromate transporter
MKKKDSPQKGKGGSTGEVLVAFLKLGLTSFGGPIAHLAYFRRELVERRKWVDDRQYAQLLALCQFLPGPASSKLGFSLGLLRAGWSGALAAFIAFTLPSALLLFAFAALLPYIAGTVGDAAIHGLKLVALAVVFGGGHVVLPDHRRGCGGDHPSLLTAWRASALVVVAWCVVASILTAALL